MTDPSLSKMSKTTKHNLTDLYIGSRCRRQWSPSSSDSDRCCRST